MPKKETFTDADLTNIARGFDAPAKEDLLEKLREQAAERDIEAQKENRAEEKSSFDDFYKRKEDECERDEGKSR